MTEPTPAPIAAAPLEAVIVNNVTYLPPERVQAETSLLRQQLAHTEAARQELEDAFRSFQIDVRNKALEVAEAESWCDAGLNAALESLGLEPKHKTYRVTVRLFAYQDVEVELVADSESSAAELATSDDRIDALWRETENQTWESTANLMSSDEDYVVKGVTELTS